jgi:hypothetical protein
LKIIKFLLDVTANSLIIWETSNFSGCPCAMELGRLKDP